MISQTAKYAGHAERWDDVPLTPMTYLPGTSWAAHHPYMIDQYATRSPKRKHTLEQRILRRPPSDEFEEVKVYGGAQCMCEATEEEKDTLSPRGREELLWPTADRILDSGQWFWTGLKWIFDDEDEIRWA